LNYLEFRAKADKEAEKERKRLWWERHRGATSETRQPLAKNSETSETRRNSTQVEVEVEVKEKTKNLSGKPAAGATKKTTKPPPDKRIGRTIGCYIAGYQEAHGDKPTITKGKDHAVVKALHACGHPDGLVDLVAYWWGKAPSKLVPPQFQNLANLQRHFDLMLRELREEGINLDLDSPALPVARFFSDPPQGQDSSGQVATVPASCG